MSRGQSSESGFLGSNETLQEVVERDTQFLRSVGVTHEQLAEKLEELFQAIGDEIDAAGGMSVRRNNVGTSSKSMPSAIRADRVGERLHGRVVRRTLRDDRDPALAVVALVEAVGVLLELGGERQRPTALRLHDEVELLRLYLNVGAAGAALALLEADRRDVALFRVAVRLAEDASRERLALRQAPADAVRNVVLLAAEEVKDGPDGWLWSVNSATPTTITWTDARTFSRQFATVGLLVMPPKAPYLRAFRGRTSSSLPLTKWSQTSLAVTFPIRPFGRPIEN
jgi:hypothetical protein